MPKRVGVTAVRNELVTRVLPISLTTSCRLLLLRGDSAVGQPCAWAAHGSGISQDAYKAGRDQTPKAYLH